MDPDELEPGYPLRWVSSRPTGFIAQEVAPVQAIQGTGSISLPPGWEHNNTISNHTFNSTDHLIQGELVFVEHTIAREIIEDRLQTPEEIKERLVQDLARKLMVNKMVEFTKSENLASGHYCFRARVFTVPDTKVRILREAGMLAKPHTT